MIEAETSPYIPATRLLVVGIFSGLVIAIVIVLLYFSLNTDQSVQWSDGIATRVIELERDLTNAKLQHKKVIEELQETHNKISLLQQNLEMREVKIRDLEEKLGQTEQDQENIVNQKQQAHQASKEQIELLYKQLAVANKKIEALEDENQKLRVRKYFQSDQ